MKTNKLGKYMSPLQLTTTQEGHMSRSGKHAPISGITSAKSEKWDKRVCNKILRLRAKKLLRGDYDKYIEPLPNECRNVWKMAKDGKHYWNPKKYVSRSWYAKMMRK